MIISISHNKIDYRIDTKNSFDISIPYEFNGKQPNFYDVKRGQIKYLESAGTTYSVAKGSGCNVPEISMNIHCSGTHTECVGHILEKPGDIGILLRDIIIPGLLITVSSIPFDDSLESYHCDVRGDEQVISKKLIQNEVEKLEEYQPQALIIRTTPNSEQKKYYRYTQHTPPFFTNDALRFINSIGVNHIVVDLPTIDRMEDNGILGNHRIFWGGENNIQADVNTKSNSTITEFAFIADDVPDGFYFLNLQLPHFVCDAAPSRPILLKAD